MKIAIASDHKGYSLKQKLIKALEQENEILDLGTTNEESTDFPKYGIALGETVIKEKLNFGIAICGTGIGISIAANKVKGIMCAKINNKEEARLAKEHNNANVIAISGALKLEEALEMIEIFMKAKPLTDEKYQRRINQIKEYENEF